MRFDTRSLPFDKLRNRLSNRLYTEALPVEPLDIRPFDRLWDRASPGVFWYAVAELVEATSH
jgi:hypothetical protein